MTNAVAAAVANKLQADGVGTIGTDLFTGPESPVDESSGSDVPENAVFIAASGGLPPDDFFGSSGSIYHERLELRIRRQTDDYAGGDAKAQAVKDSVHTADLSGDLGSDFVWCKIAMPPTYVGKNKDGLHIWTLRVNVQYHA